MSIAQFCDVMALLRKGPRSVRELVGITGMGKQTILSHLRALVDEGHVALGEPRPSVRGKAAKVYVWLDTLHGEMGGNLER